jgi:hypothetical protein
MADFSFGVIVVSICVGLIHGAVYGWLFFGCMLMALGIINGMTKK